jgi:hypothetical protein
MQAARAWAVCSVLMCGVVAIPLSACDITAGREEDEPADADAVATTTSPSAVTCTVQGAGDGFVNTPLPHGMTLGITDFEAVISDFALDAVIAVSRGTATSFNQLAAAVRFNTSSVLDVRDGSTYRADTTVTSALGHAFPIRIVADTTSHTYSVYVRDGEFTTQLARRYAFRPTQASVPSLDNLASIVDGAAGQLSICNVIGTAPTRVAYSREGSYAVFPMTADQLLASDGITMTMKLGANGQVLGQVPRGGDVTADPSGQPYVALAANGQLAVDAYTVALAPRWSRVDPVPAGTRVVSTMADAGGLMIALASSSGELSVVRYPAGGGPRTLLSVGGTHVAFAPDGFALGMDVPGSALAVGVFTNAGATVWFQGYQAAPTATIEVMTLGIGGRVVIGGHFSAPINFGGQTLEPAFNGEVDVNSYVVALDRNTGAHAFTRRIPTTRLTGAAANASRLVVAGETWVTPIFPHLWQLDTSGAFVGNEPDTGFYEQWGRSGRVALGASNRIYWERSMVWPTPVSQPFPYLLALTP